VLEKPTTICTLCVYGLSAAHSAHLRAMMVEWPSSSHFCDKLGRHLPAVVMPIAGGGSSLERE
jgi:hypothetical protein